MGKVCPLALDTMVPRAQSRDQKASLNMRSRVPNIVFFRQMDIHIPNGLYMTVHQKILAWKKSHFCALNNQGDFIKNTGSPVTFRVEMDPLSLFKLGFRITIGGHVNGGMPLYYRCPH